MEALCKLMTTIGKKLDVAKAREYMNAYFTRILEITQHSNLPARIKFMLEDLVDLRKRNWVPRQDTNAPKTIKEVHKEAAEKEKEKEKDLRNMRNAPPPRADPRGPGRGPSVPPSHGLPSMPGIYGPAPSSRGQPQRGGGGGGGGGSDWEVVGPVRTGRGGPEPPASGARKGEISLAPAGGLTASKGWASNQQQQQQQRGGQQQDDRSYGRGGGMYAVLGASMPGSQPAREQGGRGAPQREQPARNAAPAPAPPTPSVSIEKVEEQASIILDEYLSAGMFNISSTD